MGEQDKQDMMTALQAHDKYIALGFVPLSDMCDVMNDYCAEGFAPAPGTPVETLAADLSWRVGLVTTSWTSRVDDEPKEQVQEHSEESPHAPTKFLLRHHMQVNVMRSDSELTLR